MSDMQAPSNNAQPHSDIGPAYVPAIAIAGLTLIAFWSILVSGLMIWLKVLLVALLLPYAFQAVRHCIKPSIKRLIWREQDLLLQTVDGVQTSCRPLPGSFVSPAFLGLKLIARGGQRARLGLFRSQLSPEFWRQSMIRLRREELD
ncbi:MAG: hypothetical protein AAGJ52_06305 [Pseudomonadota bacterium]